MKYSILYHNLTTYLSHIYILDISPSIHFQIFQAVKHDHFAWRTFCSRRIKTKWYRCWWILMDRFVGKLEGRCGSLGRSTRWNGPLAHLENRIDDGTWRCQAHVRKITRPRILDCIRKCTHTFTWPLKGHSGTLIYRLRANWPEYSSAWSRTGLRIPSNSTACLPSMSLNVVSKPVRDDLVPTRQ